MSAFYADPGGEEWCRGRQAMTKCLFAKPLPMKKQDILTDRCAEEHQILKKEWFSRNIDLEDDEGQKAATCACGYTVDVEGNSSQSTVTPMLLEFYPPYLKVSGGQSILVKGTTSRLVMQLFEGDVLSFKIPSRLAKLRPTEKYSAAEVRSIIRTCSMYGLTGRTLFATESWENASIEGWWLKENGYCETFRREQPVGEDITGYDSENGWWKDRQCAKHRDWSRWGYRSIGPECWRRDQSRLYHLHGTEAIGASGGH
jgi:hypothetical protein